MNYSYTQPGENLMHIMNLDESRPLMYLPADYCKLLTYSPAPPAKQDQWFETGTSVQDQPTE